MSVKIPLSQDAFAITNKTRFHAIPALGGATMYKTRGDKEKIDLCGKHILRVDERGEIYCERCPARWRNEGY
jgi:hypothetical protein